MTPKRLRFFGWLQRRAFFEAQCRYGRGVAQDLAEALRWHQLAAAQGHPDALLNVAGFHEYGRGVAADVAEAIRWYRRAQAAGCTEAADRLHRLGVR